MSAIFLINIKEYDFDYDLLNAFSNEIVDCALKHKIGIHFNELGYSRELIEENKMKCYFFLSDSFLHCNASFLDMTEFAYLNMFDFKKRFFERFSFLDEMMAILKKYKIRNIELYASEDGSANYEKDFMQVTSNYHSVMEALFQAIYDASSEFAFEFPSIKVSVSMSTKK